MFCIFFFFFRVDAGELWEIKRVILVRNFVGEGMHCVSDDLVLVPKWSNVFVRYFMQMRLGASSVMKGKFVPSFFGISIELFVALKFEMIIRTNSESRICMN